MQSRRQSPTTPEDGATATLSLIVIVLVTVLRPLLTENVCDPFFDAGIIEVAVGTTVIVHRVTAYEGAIEAEESARTRGEITNLDLDLISD